MTLIITLIRPEGIWQSADNRVSMGGKIVNDNAPKQLHIVCPPLPGGPQMLLGFTGIAVMPDGTPTLKWIEETLRGDTRTIMETLDHLKERLTRDLGKSNLWKYPLIITGGIFETEKKFYFEIHNIAPNKTAVQTEFKYVVLEVTSPQVFVGGSGRVHINKADWLLLSEQIKVKPAKWEDHLGLLAAVNRRAARTDKLVSPWCQATFLSNGSAGGSSKRFSRPGEPESPLVMHTLLMGIDLSVVSMQAMKMFQNMENGNTNKTDQLDLSVKGRP